MSSLTTNILKALTNFNSWYWWADVPPKHHTEVYAIQKQTIHGEPSVRHRGIFLNDEAPALTGWVRQKFGGYNSKFYVTVFELLLRLKVGLVHLS